MPAMRRPGVFWRGSVTGPLMFTSSGMETGARLQVVAAPAGVDRKTARRYVDAGQGRRSGTEFLDVVVIKKPSTMRVYLPRDPNTLLSTYDHCLRSRHYVN